MEELQTRVSILEADMHIAIVELQEVFRRHNDPLVKDVIAFLQTSLGITDGSINVSVPQR